MSRRRFSPSARVCLTFALFVCAVSVGQTLIFFSAFRRFRSDYDARLHAVESAPPSVVSNVVVSSSPVGSTNAPVRPRFMGAGYARGTKLLFPYVDIERDGEISRHYLDPLPVGSTNVAKYIVSSLKDSLREYR